MSGRFLAGQRSNFGMDGTSQRTVFLAKFFNFLVTSGNCDWHYRFAEEPMGLDERGISSSRVCSSAMWVAVPSGRRLAGLYIYRRRSNDQRTSRRSPRPCSIGQSHPRFRFRIFGSIPSHHGARVDNLWRKYAGRPVCDSLIIFIPIPQPRACQEFLSIHRISLVGRTGTDVFIVPPTGCCRVSKATR